MKIITLTILFLGHISPLTSGGIVYEILQGAKAAAVWSTPSSSMARHASWTLKMSPRFRPDFPF